MRLLITGKGTIHTAKTRIGLIISSFSFLYLHLSLFSLVPFLFPPFLLSRSLLPFSIPECLPFSHSLSLVFPFLLFLYKPNVIYLAGVSR